MKRILLSTVAFVLLAAPLPAAAQLDINAIQQKASSLGALANERKSAFTGQIGSTLENAGITNSMNNVLKGAASGNPDALKLLDKAGIQKAFSPEALQGLGGKGLDSLMGGVNTDALGDLGKMGAGMDEIPGVTDAVGVSQCEPCKTSKSEHEKTNTVITDTFKDIQKYFASQYHQDNFVPNTAAMTQQMIVVGQQSAASLGTFMDAGLQLDAQREMQSLAAQAHASYRTDTGLCTIGTNARALAATSRRAEAGAAVLARSGINRHTQMAGSAAMGGNITDRDSRLATFKTQFCNPSDMGGAMKSVCAQNVPAATMNMDVDFGRTLGRPLTIEASFVDGAAGAETAGVYALGQNLYGNTLLPSFLPSMEKNTENQRAYVRTRGVAAKRSVLEDSYNNIAAMKARGSGTEGGVFAAAILQQMGMGADQAKAAVGAAPSYYALMELLSQKIYQSPAFFSDLYTTPENAARKDVAMQAIGLMLDRDQYKSELRSESILAVWLELEAVREQENITNRITVMGRAGEPEKPKTPQMGPIE